MVNYTLFAGFGSCSSRGVDGAECPESSSVSSSDTASVVSESEMDTSTVINYLKFDPSPDTINVFVKHYAPN